MNRLSRVVRSSRRLAAAIVIATGAASAAHADELTIGSRTEMSTMDPHALWSGTSAQFYNHYLGFLTNIGPDNSVLPAIAESWESEGENLWVFHINPDAVFQDGTKITAEDVIASYERAINSPKGSYGGLFAGVTGFSAPDPLTLEIHTERAYPTLPNAMTQIAVLPKSVNETATPEDFLTAKANVSAAPYKFIEYIPGDHLTVERNEAWFGTPAKWDRITFRFLSNPATRVTALLSGDVDLIDGVPPEDAARLRTDDRFNVVSGPSDRAVYMTFDLARDVTPYVADKATGEPLPTNPFKDLRVREALSLAVDRRAITERAIDGMAEPANQVGTPTLGGFAEDYPPKAYDPARAKELLAEAGYPDGFALTVSCMQGRLVNDARVCQVLGQMFQRIGLDVTVDVEPYAVFITKATCHCDDRKSFFMSTWASSSAGEVGIALRNVLHSYEPDKKLGVWNLGEYSNPEVDALIEQFSTVLDQEKRRDMEKQAMRMAMDDLGVLPLHMQSVILAAKAGLKPTIFGNEYTLGDYVEQTDAP
ncbi:ABC transporter substrate-binding protein [Acuticoccus mangrovi]|uniref:ABC transporter substrate-binding protein n=1 Tax=Acuticoccus mangrovi TaxID=2796142 RepID=A0A934IUT4_9HYPH|nr:ABC transporter substrate-binding protein [Acuticoccus mangrovi]MBJ3778425.1 ABC transporter substrate-binding protein [Acuticoccus mangrovi]